MKTKKTILIVEDEKSLLKAIVDILRIRNFLTLEARNGREGVQLALSKHPDLILLDLIMPEMDGMDAFAEIRADEWGANVPVVILTNLSETGDQLSDEVARFKPLYYLVKSDWKLYDIVAKIEDIFKTPNS